MRHNEFGKRLFRQDARPRQNDRILGEKRQNGTNNKIVGGEIFTDNARNVVTPFIINYVTCNVSVIVTARLLLKVTFTCRI